MSAIISQCGTYRYRLDRQIQFYGPVFAYFGINGSTATADTDDHTVRKWSGFTKLNGGSRFIVGNAFAYRSKNVAALAHATDPVGPDNDLHLAKIIAEADILVPCWGQRDKVPSHLHYRFAQLSEMLFDSGKPVKVWGLTKSGDPLHPLTLSYASTLVDWDSFLKPK
jgi:hypothetical protein